MPCLDCGRPGVRRLCDDCKAGRERRRGYADERGYGPDHRARRAEIQEQIDAGEVVYCVTCPTPNQLVGRDWDLGHDPRDRSVYIGPQCWPCNRGHRAAPPR
ncbi:hypothetical protein ACFQHV_01035 [Promicromonospora thailandica]|uniref:Uncharacterized protein n=1 Tax=Promicromonospora thailandica TaxID=765201 RepID=A0A9X2JVY0_9MICO|nr:hypothetical protein [Promicromonospora thailandica]MCP2265561.1 hypothetical protein [Promicromonospora thailandica]BFF17125.1 hypothetical protein GCM10025730_06460 [Promicromonospora thailandica]